LKRTRVRKSFYNQKIFLLLRYKVLCQNKEDFIQPKAKVFSPGKDDCELKEFIIFYYILLNCLAFIFMGWDKHQARKNRHRVSEKTLLLLGLAGGFAGAFGGMKFFHHKTRHWYFGLTFFISLLVHIIIIWLYGPRLEVLSFEKLI
jgi:uncharacterized membrane protein YsdA (DUF1294 family)